MLGRRRCHERLRFRATHISIKTRLLAASELPQAGLEYERNIVHLQSILRDQSTLREREPRDTGAIACHV